MSRLAAPTIAAASFLGVLAAWLGDRPPSAQPLDAPPELFSAARARELVERIAAAPRPPESDEHERVRSWLVEELARRGFEVQDFEASTTLYGRTLTPRNIVARLRGRASTGGVALAAHYDSVPATPGAADDGAGLAAILEAVRALRAGPPLRNDLYVIFTDLEELGASGARAIVESYAGWPEISVLLNFEARGSAGASALIETNDDNGWIVRELARADPRPVASSLYYEVYRRLPNYTDFREFKRSGVVGLSFAFAERADTYHGPTDTVERLSRASLQHHGEHALALGRHFGDLDLAVAKKTPNVVYFRLPWLGVVIYPSAWAIPLGIVALAFTGVVAARELRLRRLAWSGIFAGVGLTVGASAAAAAVAAAVIGAAMGIDADARRALYQNEWLCVAVALAALASIALPYRTLRRRFDAASLAVGALLIPLALASLTALYAPGASMLFVWPSLLTTAAILSTSSRAEDGCADTARSMVVALLSIPALVVLYPLPWSVYVGLGLAAAPALAAVIVIALAAVLPLIEVITRRT